uniref:Uncharacterized protein n=1 Tax=Oryza rufipogon TaxID=4529 RepID=A0A0E0Q0M0_ORYRU
MSVLLGTILSKNCHMVITVQTRERNTWDGKAINTTRLINSASGILRRLDVSKNRYQPRKKGCTPVQCKCKKAKGH